MFSALVRKLTGNRGRNGSPHSVLIEGWRGINHSYAMVNQYQLLELRKYPFKLFHTDLPFYNENWSAARNSGGFDDNYNQRIFSVPHHTNGIPDITYRIAYPYRFYKSPSRRLYVFGTAEFQNIDGMIWSKGGDADLNQANLRIITPSNWSKVGFVNAGVSEEKVIVLPHGVDPSIFKPGRQKERKLVRDSFRIRDEDFAILSLGAMTWNKGIDTLLCAYSTLRKRFPHIRLILKDQSNLYRLTGRNLLEEMKSKYPNDFTNDVTSSIAFVSDNLTLVQLSNLYNAADCYVSSYRAEGFNLPGLEAAACGIPVVLTAGGATDDYCHESFALRVKGERSREGNKTYIEPALDDLIDSISSVVEGAVAQFNRRKAVEHIRNHYSWSRIVETLVDVFAAEEA